MVVPRSLRVLALVVAAVLVGGTLPAQTRLLRQPTVSTTQIAFAYANNLWVPDRAGGTARRLTSLQRQTSHPHFSPDGQWIAFSAPYGCNLDAYGRPPARRETVRSQPALPAWGSGRRTWRGWARGPRAGAGSTVPRTAAPRGRWYPCR